MYHWGAEPGVYFFARQQTPVSFVYNMPLTDRTERSRRYTAQVRPSSPPGGPSCWAVRKELATVDHPIQNGSPPTTRRSTDPRAWTVSSSSFPVNP